MNMQLLASVLAAVMLMIGLMQSVRTKTCRIDRKSHPAKLAVWIASAAAMTVAVGASPAWSALVMAATLIAASLIVTVLTRIAWRLGL